MRLILEDGTEVKLCNELVEQLNKAVSAAKKEKKKDTGFFDGEYREDCLTICYDGEINKTISDEKSSEFLNEFTSREFAEKIRNRQLLERKLIKFSLEHDGDKIDWDDADNSKYHICYSYADNELSVNSVLVTNRCGVICFYSKEIADKSIEEYHDDLIKYFTEWRIL